tara:strand:+ start:7911 stop:8930 length:1020 start_codon:yes stop_codon:yes gene_type:complete
MKSIKHIIFCLIIFSNTSFGKEFDELFIIYERIESASKIEQSINNSFNTMIYRLSGNSSPSNIWKIINAGNTRKDFIKSYSIKNLSEESFLQVYFDKDLLIKKFNELSIPIIGNSRPVILFLIKIDSGSEDPYYLSASEFNSKFDSLIVNLLKDTSLSRGIFLELPEFDLFNKNELSKNEKILNSNNFIASQYESDAIIQINITNIGISSWAITGDINQPYQGNNFNDFFIDVFNKLLVAKVDKLLKNYLIDISKENLITITIDNINNFDNYKKSKTIIENLIGIKEIDISRFRINKITYKIKIFGDINDVIKGLSSNSFIEINDIFIDTNSLELTFNE